MCDLTTHSSHSSGSRGVSDEMPEQVKPNQGLMPVGVSDLIPQPPQQATGTKRPHDSDNSIQSNNSPARKVNRPTEVSMNEDVVVRNLAEEFGDDDDDAAMEAAEFSPIEKL